MIDSIYVQSLDISYSVDTSVTVDLNIITSDRPFDHPKEFCKEVARELYRVLTEVHSCGGELTMSDDDFFYKDDKQMIFCNCGRNMAVYTDEQAVDEEGNSCTMLRFYCPECEPNPIYFDDFFYIYQEK